MEKIENSINTLKKYYDNWHLEPDHFGLQVVEKAVNDLLKAIKSRLEAEEKYNFK